MADSGKSTGTLAIDKILPNDKRVSHEFAEVNGRKWRKSAVREFDETSSRCLFSHRCNQLSK